MKNKTITFILQGMIVILWSIVENNTNGFLFGYSWFNMGVLLDILDYEMKK